MRTQPRPIRPRWPLLGRRLAASSPMFALSTSVSPCTEMSIDSIEHSAMGIPSMLFRTACRLALLSRPCRARGAVRVAREHLLIGCPEWSENRLIHQRSLGELGEAYHMGHAGPPKSGAGM